MKLFSYVFLGLTVIVFFAVTGFYVLDIINEYRYLNNCSAQEIVRSPDDAIEAVRRAAQRDPRFQRIGVAAGILPDGSYADEGKFSASAHRGNWGFTQYSLLFRGNKGGTIEIHTIDQCGRFYDDSVFVMSP